MTPGKTAIANAADLLDIGEFDFLERAWIEHYGTRPSKVQQENLFREAVLGQRTPFWALDYAHKILQEETHRNPSRLPEENSRQGRILAEIPVVMFLGACLLVLGLLIFTPEKEDSKTRETPVSGIYGDWARD